MIELNLLPDVKADFIKAQKTRRTITGIALLVSAASVVLLLGLLSFGGLQRKHLNDLNRDIATDSRRLEEKPQINKILTVQNQLQSLPDLHASKPAASRLFDYLNRLTPVQVSITNLEIDFTQQTATITGTADALSNVNKYVDTLKFTTYTTQDNSTSTKAFNNVVLGSFALNSSQSGEQPATYTVTLAYDKVIFDITQDVKLSVPSLITTRAQIEQPNDLFTAPTNGGDR